MPAVNAIIELDVLKAYLKIKNTDAADDDFLESAIDIASGSIEEFIGGPAVVQEYSNEIYDGPGCEILYLRHWPVVALKTPNLADVQYRVSPKDDWQTLSTDIAYILIKTEKPWVIKLYDRTFPLGDANIRISYKAGYDPVPQDFIRVCTEMAAELYKESARGDGRLGRRSIAKTTGGTTGSDTYYELADRHKTILRRYRHIRA